MSRMIRRIWVKWVLAVLAAVVLPFVGFAFFVNSKMSSRLSGDVVHHYLLSMAADLADRIDAQITERRLDADTIADNPLLEWFIGDYDEDSDVFGSYVQHTFNRLVAEYGVYDLVLAVDAGGAFEACSRKDGEGRDLPAEVVAKLEGRNHAHERWFRAALDGGFALIDHHESDLVPPKHPGSGPHPENYHIGFASRIDTRGASEGPVGVVLLLMNWRRFHDEILSYGVRHLAASEADRTSPALGTDIYESSYAWIWKSDADTILAHKDTSLYGKRVSQPPIELPQMVDAARGKEWGMYPEYAFRGVRKNAAFRRCKGPEDGGFGWYVGVGVDNQDIFAPVYELSRQLFSATFAVLAAAVVWTVWIARRTTRPILDLQAHTRRIAGGDLDARIDVGTSDELGDLGRAFNRMTAELKENREQLVKAEKDAAWREMARQVAHEIKNPLTPISLSAGLLKRAREEKSEDFDRIFDNTIDVIQRQVETMRGITRDFYSFAGEHKEPRAFDSGQVVDEVLALNAGWAQHQGVRIRRTGGGATVHGDPAEFKSAVTNLVSNALEAMPEGGDLGVGIEERDGVVTVEVRDSGVGITGDVAQRLFEPYFTTRSKGTGLGLAIVRRVVEEMGGEVELRNRDDGRGALARITLPRPA